MDAQIAATLTTEGYQTPRLAHPFTSKMVWHLREKWRIPTVKLNGKERSPAQWEDGSYSVEGAAAKLGVSQDTIFAWLKTGRLKGEHLGRTVHLQCACRSCGSSDDQTVRHPRTLCHFARFDSGLAQP